MARLGCLCGHTMSNTSCPCECEIYVYYEKEILDAIAYNPELTWMDFQTDWDELHECKKMYMQRNDNLEYWFCPKCKRVYEVSNTYNRWVRVYKRTEEIPKVSTEGWGKIYVYTDLEEDPITEDNVDITVKDFFRCFPYKFKFRLSPDEKTVIAYNMKGKEAFAYELEEYWQPKDGEYRRRRY